MLIHTHSTFAPRIATYSQDGLGLGHMRRTHLIARQLLRLCPTASVLTLSDSPLGQFFTPAPNHDYVKLPSIVKDGPGQWRASNLNLPFAAVSELRQELICQTILNFRPHLLLVDHMPHGAMGELLPTLAALRTNGAETKVVLGLRDILDAPQVVQQRWQVEGAYDAVERYYDQVLVYGMREIFDLATQYRFSPQVARRLHYCGYVGEMPAPNAVPAGRGHTTRKSPGAAIRAKYLRGPHACAKLIVAMAGGGADAYPLMRTLVDALPAIQQRHRTLLLLITGPFMPADLQADLKARAHGRPVQLITSVDDSAAFLQAADLVVAMAGYNTSVEILQSGKRALIVPRRGPSAEQRTRTQLFAERGWVDMLDPDKLAADILAALVIKNLSLGATTVPSQSPQLDGVQAAASALLALLVPSDRASTRRPQGEKAYAMAYA